MKKTKDAEIFEEIPKIYDAELRKCSREYGPWLYLIHVEELLSDG